MKTKLCIFLWLAMTTTAYACGGDGGCGSSYDACGNSDASSCSCVDPTCSDPYSCIGHGACCSAFGNIGALDSSPESEYDDNDNDYSYNNTSNLFADNSRTVVMVPAHTTVYRSYKGE